MPTGFVFGNSDFSSVHADLDTYSFSVDTNQSKGILGFHPNTVGQICHAQCHSDNACPNRYKPCQQ